MSLVVLWSDWMIWLLCVALALWVVKMRQSPQFLAQWQQIFSSKVAVVSAIILLTYLLIALADSLHFNFEGQVFSLLDWALHHLIVNSERTYSAPFAHFEYSRSMVLNSAGEVQHIYQPLKAIAPVEGYGWKSAVLALLTTQVVWGSAWAYQKKYRVGAQFWVGIYTLMGLVFVLSLAYFLSFYVHVLGTDKVGADVLYNSLKSIRTGVLIGVLTTLVMLPLALLLGISAGLFRGWVDDVIQYLYTTLNAIPGVLLIAASVLVMQTIMGNHPEWFTSTEARADVRLVFLIFILGITSWTGLCRLLRAETLKISQVEFVQSARAFGVSKWAIISKHILPNVMHLVLIAVVLDFSGLVLAEAVLSYVGVGVDPTMHSWGNMINQARLEMAREPMVWWSLVSAFVFMFVLVLAANLFSDRIQVVLDPRNRAANK